MTERLSIRLMDFKFLISTEQPRHRPRCSSNANESAVSNSPSKNAWRAISHSEQGPVTLIPDSFIGGMRTSR